MHEKFTLKAGSPFLVMEYIPKNLYRFVEDHKTPESQGLPKSQVWTIGRGTANGLMYLHTLNPPISHRDLKPDNILVRFCSCIQYNTGDISHSPPGFSGLIYNSVWGTLAILLVTQFLVLIKEVKDAPVQHPLLFSNSEWVL